MRTRTTKGLVCVALVVAIVFAAWLASRPRPEATLMSPPRLESPIGEQVRRTDPAPPEDPSGGGLGGLRGGLDRGEDAAESSNPEAREHLARAGSARAKKELDSEIESLRLAVRADARFGTAWSDLCDALLRRSSADLDAALEAARKSVELVPDHWGALYNLACVRARRGEREEALEALRKAIESNERARGAARTDPDLNALRADPAFQKLVKQP